jgi:hypothetical protein
MLNPSRQVVVVLVVASVALLALGLATGVGLFGWSLAVLIGLYLAVAWVARVGRRGAPAA